MRRALALFVLAALPVAACTQSSLPSGASETTSTSPTAADLGSAVTASAAGGRAGSTGVVSVTSQNLYYDTFVATDPLPMKGRFQQLVNGTTELGPGQPGYLGGRWWEDTNGNGIQDAGDHFFLCPLLPPGRPTP